MEEEEEEENMIGIDFPTWVMNGQRRGETTLGRSESKSEYFIAEIANFTQGSLSFVEKEEFSITESKMSSRTLLKQFKKVFVQGKTVVAKETTDAVAVADESMADEEKHGEIWDDPHRLDAKQEVATFKHFDFEIEHDEIESKFNWRCCCCCSCELEYFGKERQNKTLNWYIFSFFLSRFDFWKKRKKKKNT